MRDVIPTPAEKLRALFLSLFVGIFLGRFPEFFPLGMAFSGFLFFSFFLWKDFKVLLLGVFLLGFSYASCHHAQLKNSSWAPFWGREVVFHGQIESFPDQREKDTRFFVKGFIEDFPDHQGRILLLVSPSEKYTYGDQIKLEGVLQKPPSFEDFNYQKYLERFGVTALLKFPSLIEKKETKGGSIFFTTGQKVRSWMAQNLEKNLPLAHGKIAMGILVGVKNELPSSLQEDFKRSGLMHILVVSGFNVSVIILLFTYIFGFLGRRFLLIFTLLGLGFFLTLTGFDPPVLRAAFMGAAVAWAVSLGRNADTRNVILLTIVLLGALDPFMIQRDIGFFLSLFATLGIVLGLEYRERFLKFLPWEWLRIALGVTLCAQIAVLPFLILYFESFPIAGLLANLVTEPLIPPAMGASFIVSVLGFLPSFISSLISVPATILLELIVQIASLFSKIPPLSLPSWSGHLFLWPLVIFFARELFKKK